MEAEPLRSKESVLVAATEERLHKDQVSRLMNLDGKRTESAGKLRYTL
jgi:hypothetical protein